MFFGWQSRLSVSISARFESRGKLWLTLFYRPDVPSVAEGYPMREWSIKVFIVGADGEELPATCFDKVTYKLHESFGPRAKQGKNTPFPVSTTRTIRPLLLYQQEKDHITT